MDLNSLTKLEVNPWRDAVFDTQFEIVATAYPTHIQSWDFVRRTTRTVVSQGKDTSSATQGHESAECHDGGWCKTRKR